MYRRDPILDALVIHATRAETAAGQYDAARRQLRRRAGGALVVAALLAAVWLIPGTGAGVRVWMGLWLALALMVALVVHGRRRERRRRQLLDDALAGLAAASEAAARALAHDEVAASARPYLEEVLEDARRLHRDRRPTRGTRIAPPVDAERKG